MKPADHPEYFRVPAPEGRSRESTIVLDRDGNFWHDGTRVDHSQIELAFHQWISRHPDDGRYVLTNGYDWTYFTVDDVPYFVRDTRVGDMGIELLLSDGTSEPWNLEDTTVDGNGRLQVLVKDTADGGPYTAKFSRLAQQALEPLLHDEEGQVVIRTRFGAFSLPAP